MNFRNEKMEIAVLDWAGAMKLAHVFLFNDGITYEHRYNAHMERMLLAILLIAAQRDDDLTLGRVENMARQLDADPDAFSKNIRHPEVAESSRALDQILGSVGSLLCEPTKQLLLSINNGLLDNFPHTTN
jgi:hypothetical protein